MTPGEAESSPAISTLGDLLAHAYAIEVDALERYRMLADQMEFHNNHELAKIFTDFAGHEEKHAAKIAAQAQDLNVSVQTGKELDWPEAESPEMADLSSAHYLMTPWHALQMALAAEKRAFAFFEQMVNSTEIPEIKEWATAFREEEAEHVRLVERLLEDHPEPAEGWDDDDDPPNLQD